MENRNSLLIIGALVLFLLAGCSKASKANDAQAAAGQDQTQSQTQEQGKTDSVNFNGVVTVIGDNQITVAKNPTQMQQGGGPGAGKGGPDGNGGPQQNSSSDAQSPGSGPQQSGSNDQQPPENPDGQGQPARGSGSDQSQSSDISSWEKVTCKIDENTSIVMIQFNDQKKAEETEAGLSDISVGANVMVTLRSDGTGYADKVQIMKTQK